MQIKRRKDRKDDFGIVQLSTVLPMCVYRDVVAASGNRMIDSTGPEKVQRKYEWTRSRTSDAKRLMRVNVNSCVSDYQYTVYS